MQQNEKHNMDIKFQALWDNLVADAMDTKAYQIIIYNYPGRQTVYLKGNSPEDHGYKRFQVENTFLEQNFNAFSEYVYVKLGVNLNKSACSGFSKYEDIKLTYSYDTIGQGNFIYLSIVANKPAPTLGDLGFTQPQLNEIRNILNKENIGILVSGATGSGKTSTVSHLITEIAKNYTILDVEELEGSKVGFVLRSDIDRISIGELRTFEHLQETIKLREHGCQVIGTIHATSPLQSIERLHSLSNSTAHQHFDLLINQTLIKKLCPYCSISLDSVSEQLEKCETAHDANFYNTKEQLRISLKKLYKEVDLSAVKIKSPHGCEYCDNKGTSGLTLCASVIPIDPRMHELIEEKQDVHSYLRLMADNDPLSDNMAGKSVKEHAVYHMLRGIVDPQDVYDKFSYL